MNPLSYSLQDYIGRPLTQRQRIQAEMMSPSGLLDRARNAFAANTQHPGVWNSDQRNRRRQEESARAFEAEQSRIMGEYQQYGRRLSPFDQALSRWTGPNEAENVTNTLTDVLGSQFAGGLVPAAQRVKMSGVMSLLDPRVSPGQVASGLPMDEASRAARAKSLNFKDDVYHATTHDIDAFDMSKASAEGDWGAGIYASSSKDDASINYSDLSSQDLTARIEMRADQLEYDLGRDEAMKQAKAELYGGKSRVMDLKARIEKPFRLGGDDSTFLSSETKALDPADYMDEAKATSGLDVDDFDSVEEFDEAIKEAAEELAMEDSYNFEPEGPLVDFIDSLRSNYGDEAAPVIDELADRVYDGGISAKDLDDIIRKTEWYPEGPEGEHFVHEAYRQALQDAGFDGVIDSTVYNKFGHGSGRTNFMDGIDPDTKHYVLFNANQLRKTDAAFDPAKKDSANLMHGIGAAGAGGLMYNEQEKPNALRDAFIKKGGGNSKPRKRKPSITSVRG